MPHPCLTVAILLINNHNVVQRKHSRTHEFRVGSCDKSLPRIVRKIVVLILVTYLTSYLVSRLRSSGNAVSVETLGLPAAPPNEAGILGIGTYNIAHGRGGKLGASKWDGGDTPEKRRRLVEIGTLLEDMGLDVVVLNEVDFSCVWSGHMDQAAVIAKAGGFAHIARQRSFDVSFPFVNTVFGNAILSRHPIVTAWIETLEPLSRLEALLAGNHDSLIAKIRLPDGAIVAVWGVHLEVRSMPVRLLAADYIISRGRELREPLLVVGDLNSTMPNRKSPSSSRQRITAVSHLLGSGLFQPFPAVGAPHAANTFPSENPRLTIDWILYPKAWKLHSGTVRQSNLSDHLPVAAFFDRGLVLEDLAPTDARGVQ